MDINLSQSPVTYFLRSYRKHASLSVNRLPHQNFLSRVTLVATEQQNEMYPDLIAYMCSNWIDPWIYGSNISIPPSITFAVHSPRSGPDAFPRRQRRILTGLQLQHAE